MAIAIGGAVTIMASSFLVGVGQVQKAVILRSEMEDLRSMILPKVDCNEECAGLTPGERELGLWTIQTQCHELFKDAKVTMKHKKIAQLDGPLSSIDAWVCKPRRPKQCLYACHTSGILLEKGYLFPAIAGQSIRGGSDLKCPVGDVIGVDFSTARIICAKTSDDLLSGPMCKQDVTFTVAKDQPHEVSIAGKIPCSQHTQDQARIARINGPLAINIDANYKLSAGESFVIVRAERIIGTYTNAQKTIDIGQYSFQVIYQENKVILRVAKINKS